MRMQIPARKVMDAVITGIAAIDEERKRQTEATILYHMGVKAWRWTKIERGVCGVCLTYTVTRLRRRTRTRQEVLDFLCWEEGEVHSSTCYRQLETLRLMGAEAEAAYRSSGLSMPMIELDSNDFANIMEYYV